MRFVSVSEYLMGRARVEDLDPLLLTNLNILICKINDLLERFGGYRAVSSGYRRPEDNAKVAAPKTKSCHLTCEAVDLEDKDGKLKSWCMNHLGVLEELGLYMEAPIATPTWCHLQTRRPKSGNRVFNP